MMPHGKKILVAAALLLFTQISGRAQIAAKPKAGSQTSRKASAKQYEHEGHLFAKPAHQRDKIERTVAWFDAHLK
jgi:hypothetical protein